MTRVSVAPELLRWARERAGHTLEELAAKAQFKNLPGWEKGEAQPTLNQLEAFARAVRAPIGYLFLPEPPEESVPMPELRNSSGQPVTHPSPNLQDMIYACQERQNWYRDYARVAGEPELQFVGSGAADVPPEEVAAKMRETLGFNLRDREWQDRNDDLREFTSRAEEAGVLVMISGVVGNNNHRLLDLAEFRAFTLCDPFAPLIFVNAADTGASRMFTLAHELAHIWLGVSSLSNLDASSLTERSVSGLSDRPIEEAWCRAVAAEFLVPLASLRLDWRTEEPLPEALPRLARVYKVSERVISCRLLDAGWLDRASFDALAQYVDRRPTLPQGVGGGDFYRRTLVRVSRRFARAVISSTLEGQTLYRDAFRMLGVSSTATFNRLGLEAGVIQ